MIPAGKGTVVFCDANVLYSYLLRDLLMWLGVDRTLSLRWTERIYQEWSRNLLAQRPDLAAERLARTFEQMNRAIPKALVPPASEEDVNDLPDPDDRHVLAAALACEAEVLLTFNLKDFPVAAVPSELRVVHPDLFLLTCLSTQPQAMTAALRNMRANLKQPPMTAAEVTKGFQRAGLPQFSQAIGQLEHQF